MDVVVLTWPWIKVAKFQKVFFLLPTLKNCKKWRRRGDLAIIQQFRLAFENVSQRRIWNQKVHDIFWGEDLFQLQLKNYPWTSSSTDLVKQHQEKQEKVNQWRKKIIWKKNVLFDIVLLKGIFSVKVVKTTNLWNLSWACFDKQDHFKIWTEHITP